MGDCEGVCKAESDMSMSGKFNQEKRTRKIPTRNVKQDEVAKEMSRL